MTYHERRYMERLIAAVESLQSHVEELGCTCASGKQRNSYHSTGRRRRDSGCTGVALAVTDRSLVQRAKRLLKQKDWT